MLSYGLYRLNAHELTRQLARAAVAWPCRCFTRRPGSSIILLVWCATPPCDPMLRPPTLAPMHSMVPVSLSICLPAEQAASAQVGAIVPWNYPFHNVFNPLTAALFAGNGIVIKVRRHHGAPSPAHAGPSWPVHGCSSADYRLRCPLCRYRSTPAGRRSTMAASSVRRWPLRVRSTFQILGVHDTESKTR